MHGGGKSFAISSSGGNTGFSNSNGGGVNAELLLAKLVDAFGLCLVLLLLLLEDDTVADSDDNDDDEEPTTVELLPVDLLLVADTEILSDLDEAGIGCSIPIF